MSGAMNKPRFEGRRVKLEEVCEIRSGGTPKRSVLEYWQDGTIPWVKISDMKGKYVCSTEECITESGMSNSSAKLFEKGTILYSIFASIGEVGILKIPAATNQAIAGFRVKDEYKGSVDRDYLYHWLRSRKALSKHSGRGAAQNNINLSILKSMELELPAIGDQRCIAAQFERVARLEEGVCNQLAALDDLRKSRFLEMFGDPADGVVWPCRRLDEICTIVTGNTPPRKDPSNYGDYIEWCKTDNITDAKYLTAASEMLSERGVSKGRVAPAGSILMACIAGSVKSIGKVAIANRRVAFNQQINALIPGEMIDAEYLLWALRLSKDYLCSGVNMQLKGILNKTSLSAKSFCIPPLSLQRDFAAFVRQVDKLESAARASIDRLQTLYDSLAQEYFG